MGLKRPAQSVEAAKKVAKGANHNISRQVANSVDESLADEVWSQTLEELEQNWTWLDENCDPAKHLLAKRFGLRQGDKVRLIDDCSAGGFNSTCGVSERLRVHAIDELASYIAWCLTHLSSDALDEVVGKTYDLKSAYKQYGVRAYDKELLRLAVWDPKAKLVRYLGINALPFGAVGSVSSFLRVAMAVWFLGVKGLRLCWTSFFDDYTLLSRKLNAKSAKTSAECLFQLLGITFAKEGKKAVEWGTRMKTLGVVLDLSPESDSTCNQRHVTLGHTESRIQELQKTIDEILTLGRMSCKDAERLRGRLQWFESFAHGRIAQQSLRVISGLASVGRQKEQLGEKEVSALEFLRNRVLTAAPTKVLAANLRTWMVFSDGACEGETEKVGTLGAVLFDPEGQACEFFSETLDNSWMRFLLEESKHPIFEIELLAVLVALNVWEPKLRYCQCVFYLDNEAARGSLIAGATPSSTGSSLVSEFVRIEMRGQIKVWFARVPTSSNVADKPSRLKVTELVTEGVSRVACQCSTLL